MVDESLNKILKEMWRLDEKIISGEQLIDIEKDFYNTNLAVIKNYYENNRNYWQEKNIL